MTEKPIIVGVDASPEAGRAALAGWQLAAALRAPCRLIHAIPDVWSGAALDQVPIMPGPSAAIVDEARRRVADALSAELPPEALAAIEVQVGRPAAVLAGAAAGAQLVVLGANTRTAHSLVRSVDAPVLVMALAGWPIRRVLAAVDLSFASEPTLAAARRLAQGMHARLRVLHIAEPVHATHPGARVDEDAVYREALDAFNQATAGLPELEAGERVMRRGPAADMIAAEAASWGADIVVVGSHGKGWVERVLIGSVTERLLAMLPASLLIVPVLPVERPTEWAESPTRVRKGTVMF